MSLTTPTRQGLPSVAAVETLGRPFSRLVPPEWKDENGHVNVCHHFAFHMDVNIACFRQFGVDEAYVRDRGLSTFSIEQNIRYYDEVLVGHQVSGYVRILDVSPKLVHAISVVVDETTGRIANTVEFVEGHVDLTTRRTTPWPADLLKALETRLAEHRALEWSLPLSAGVGLRGN
ncbi:thioesterase family protein [Nocardioides albus]|uniref:Acyl-CoA thioester hydrolase n=1 Tax=Nocardioides albus TaxID=1841 RepID=A0A7W5A3J3_9ACTN|nr:thioesterase family protein [Nocardioides albus]MBB3089012.1 acyl-CoA thioester hydrolase [Nocardioides albus]GGU14819.1 hypothetical protein GCM10007979_11750 [Nocardioides albus]